MGKRGKIGEKLLLLLHLPHPSYPPHLPISSAPLLTCSPAQLLNYPQGSGNLAQLVAKYNQDENQFINL